MNEYDLKKLISNKEYLDKKIFEFIEKKELFKQKIDYDEINGHLLKSQHNLRFIEENIKLNFLDWSITGCYYACYHSALALIMTKEYTSKNHFATLCILIKEFYEEIDKKDLEILFELLDYQDVLFYVESKNKREDASYSTKLKFNKQEVINLKLNASIFVTKIKNIVETNL